MPITPDPAQLNLDAFVPLRGGRTRWAFEGNAFVYATREANGNNVISNHTVTRMTFAGYDSGGSPIFGFFWPKTESGGALTLHDHRNNFNGGFAFSTFRPWDVDPDAAAGALVNAWKDCHYCCDEAWPV